MIKLYNNSKISDDIILPLLKHGIKLSNVKGTIGIRITNGKRGGGFAFDCNKIRWGKIKRWVNVNGAFEITPYLTFNFIEGAQSFWKTILHELKHIYDFQNKHKEFLPFSTDGTYNYIKKKWKRRPPHDERPEELRANKFTKENKNNIEDELILNLAIELERIIKLKYKDGIP